jgi:hypothetical protein
MMVECILSSEIVQRGVTWDTLRVSAAVEYNFSPAQLFSILAFDVVLYGLLTWYCDQVLISYTSPIEVLPFYPRIWT